MNLWTWPLLKYSCFVNATFELIPGYLFKGNDHLTTTANTGQHYRVLHRPVRWALYALGDSATSTSTIQCQLAFAFPTQTTGQWTTHTTTDTNHWPSRPWRWWRHCKQPRSWWPNTVIPNPWMGRSATTRLWTQFWSNHPGNALMCQRLKKDMN